MIQRLQEHEVVENCRFYEQKFPKLEEFVVVRVKSIAETAAYVELLEYGNMDGMIPLSELSRIRIRSRNKHIRIGKTEIVQVIRVDNDKGYIDLSKKRVRDEDRKPCELRYNKAKDVHSIMEHVARECKVNLESLYRVVGWPLYHKYGHAFEAFGVAFADPEKVFDPLGIEPDIKEKLVSTIRHRHKVQPFRARSDVEVTCFKYEGIDAIREALLEGEKSTHGRDITVCIRLQAAPTYVIVATAIDKDQAVEAVKASTAAIEKVILAKGGNLKVTKLPTIVNTDEISKLGSKDEDEDDDEEGSSEEEDDAEGNNKPKDQQDEEEEDENEEEQE